MRPGMDAIDVGSHVGEYALLAAALVVPSGRVYAFEPQEALCELIRRSASENRLENLEVIPAAVSDADGDVPFGIDPRSLGGWIRDQGDMCPSISLDRFAAERDLSRLGFLKIDAGGHEAAVLRGGADLLNSDRSLTLLCKLYNPGVTRERFGLDPLEAVSLLLDWSYRLVALTQPDVSIESVQDAKRLVATDVYSFVLRAERPTKRTNRH